jgi:hypothetical protein
MLPPQSTGDRFFANVALSSKVSPTSRLSQHASTLFITLLLHLGVFVLLLLSWEPEHKHLVSQFDVTSRAKPKLTAYFISAKELRAKMGGETSSKQTTEQISRDPQAVDLDTSFSKPLAKRALKQAPKLLSDPKAELKPANALDEINDVTRKVTAAEVLAATQRYLQAQAESSLTAISGSHVRETNNIGASLSEMTPEMTRYQVKTIEDKIQPTTSNHRLDPNRRVKIGDTCYKVVNLSTQINPYGEGLGFAEPCDPVNPTKRALDAAIGERLSKMSIR